MKVYVWFAIAVSAGFSSGLFFGYKEIIAGSIAGMICLLSIVRTEYLINKKKIVEEIK
jgi:hypothetical protein